MAVRRALGGLIRAVVLALLSGQGDARAQELRFPLACELWRDCWIVRYPDSDPSPAARDPFGGLRTAEGHAALDIAVADLAAVARGVEVRAVADGVVVAVRDGEPDVDVRVRGREAVAGRECGNGVRILHPSGLESRYCHLRRGSVMVREGDRVTAGALLGLVGLSGRTSFPHLELSLMRDARPVDPFRERAIRWPAGLDMRRYPLVVITGLGVAAGPIEGAGLRQGFYAFARLAPTAPALVGWVRGFWWQKGDRVRFQLHGPKGRVFDRIITVARDRAFGWFYVGEERPGQPWPEGVYRLVVTVRRGERSLDLQGGILVAGPR